MPSLTYRRPDGSESATQFGAKPVILGRLAESDVPIHDAFVSRVHAGISFASDRFVLKDLGSANGTYRNGNRVFESPLSSGDKIQIGNTALLFEVDPQSGDATLREVPRMVAGAHTPKAASPPAPDVTSKIPLPGVPPRPH